MSKPVLYGPGFSTYVRTPRIAFAEKGVDYELVEFNFLEGMPKEQLARQPFGKVPAFEHDGFALYESCAISRYIDEGFDGPALQPKDAKARARMTQVISILDSYTYACTIGALVIQRLVMPKLGNEPDEQAIKSALPSVDKAMTVLNGVLGKNQFLAGDTFTLADMHLAPIFHYFTATEESAPILEPLGELRGWWDRVQSRESVKSTEPQLG